MLLLEYGFDSPQFATVLFSVVAAILSLFLADRPPSARKTGARTVAIALLAVLSLVQEGPLLLTAGLLAFAAGQAFLVQDDETASIIALVFFVAGQAVYGAWLFPSAQVNDMLTHPLLLAPLALGLVAIVIATVRLSGLESRMRLFAIGYLFAALAGLFLAFATRSEGVSVGCLLLLIFAWCILALRQNPEPAARQNWMPAVLWALFYCAQLLITLAALNLL